ncbi:response regulator transcription factor [Knoellia sp. S7-12]|uniref:response regulator transcription factor n=1 Tax=Knoellia sp. S7-12 TaxID=3126698 RepID=UPI0033686995
MIRVLVVDDHAMVRAGLIALLEASGTIEIVGQAANGAEAIAVARDCQPEVVLMDLSMPVMGGGEATREVLKVAPEAKVVVLTSFSDRDAVKAALRAGAIGYQLKDAEPTELLAAVRAAAQGYAPVDARVAGVLLPTAADREGDGLSPREHEVLELVAQGLANKQIGRVLGISERTVKAHLGRIFREIGVLDRTSAALWARDNPSGQQ